MAAPRKRNGGISACTTFSGDAGTDDQHGLERCKRARTDRGRDRVRRIREAAHEGMGVRQSDAEQEHREHWIDVRHVGSGALDHNRFHHDRYPLGRVRGALENRIDVTQLGGEDESANLGDIAIQRSERLVQ